jgi:hypothetical protein
LDDILKDATAGDPMTGLKWTRKTPAKFSRDLKWKRFKAGRTTVRRLMRERKYALRVNRKRLTKQQDPNRDRQMRYISRVRRAFIKVGRPAISVDTKKKELVGPFRNSGRTWRQKPVEVLDTDFLSDAVGKAIPYGIYDPQHYSGYLMVGTSHETAQFAVAAIRAWWIEVGRSQYVGQDHLLIEADGGGANSSSSWLWKYELQLLVDEFGLTITVTHYPPGASKWNPIEHRMFSLITQNWAGQPLVDYRTLLNFARTAGKHSGFHCKAHLDITEYETRLKVTKEQKAQIKLSRRRVFPKWNYTIEPHTSPDKNHQVISG